jgi:hypothetical protein
MHLLFFESIPYHAQNKINQRIHCIVVLLRPKAEWLRQKLLASFARKLRHSGLDVAVRHAQTRALNRAYGHTAFGQEFGQAFGIERAACLEQLRPASGQRARRGLKPARAAAVAIGRLQIV